MLLREVIDAIQETDAGRFDVTLLAYASSVEVLRHRGEPADVPAVQAPGSSRAFGSLLRHLVSAVAADAGGVPARCLLTLLGKPTDTWTAPARELQSLRRQGALDVVVGVGSPLRAATRPLWAVCDNVRTFGEGTSPQTLARHVAALILGNA
ncbi:hypothetical protein OG598_14810 [Micromonospora sp. NBC_00330]|uniref:hypothetical protein n=1 Tax=Micromonospora sp. NBC_00330 TaxID=2903585 RepID=UPI002E2BDA9B|nr:hypothetical protein [Micromonospora sp. NBC_00330]